MDSSLHTSTPLSQMDRPSGTASEHTPSERISPERIPSERTADSVLDELLDRELAYDTAARGGFISHLAMSLVAARRLGASDEELRQAFDSQTSDGFLIPRARPEWLDGRIAEIDRIGIDTAVREALPGMIDTPLFQFFHAVIRLELAIDAGHAGQVANALENWEGGGHPLAAPPDGEGDRSFDEVLSSVVTHPERRMGGVREVHALAEQDWFRDALTRLRFDDQLSDDIASAVIGFHIDPSDFGALHMVTGTRAVRAVLPYLDPSDRRRATLRLAHAVAALITLHADAPDSERVDERVDEREQPPDWATIARAAIDSGDPHVVKLVYAARLEEQATGDPRYRAVAARQAVRRRR